MKIELLIWALIFPLSALAQPTQPFANQRPGLTPGGCAWLVPWGMEYAQPKQLPPSEVAGKNARGCLSQFDAYYGLNGCPLKYCNYKDIGE